MKKENIKKQYYPSMEEHVKKWKLDEEERKLLEWYESEKWEPLSKEELKKENERLASYVRYTKEKRKNKNMNIRMQQSDIDKLKNKSLKLGIPYQTIAASILHQYANDMIEVKL